MKLIRETERPFVVTYIHGWHNNATLESGDVGRFRKLLYELGDAESIKRSRFHLIGVYLGWRGEIIKPFPVNELTFWNRKAAAERLASNFDCFDAIASISEATRANHQKQEQYTILLGHSFGALVAERAVAHAINAEMHGTRQEHSSSNSETILPADLILLLNPASDAILTRQMIAALYSRHLEGTRQFVVSMTSTGDGATGKWFQVGTSLAAISKHFDKVGIPGRPADKDDQKESEKVFYTTTPGHNALLINHRTEPIQTELPSSKKAFEANLSRDLGPYSSDRYVFATPKGDDSASLKLWRFNLQGQVDVPYWDVKVDPEIIKDHGDIWNDKALAMMAAIFRMNFPLPTKLVSPSFRAKVSAPEIPTTPLAPESLRAPPAEKPVKAPIAPKSFTAPLPPKPNLQRTPDFKRLY